MTEAAPTLASIARALEGRVPATIATCAPDGTPNVSILSHVHHVDATHVALSHQFFGKTRANLMANPRAELVVFDPATAAGYRLLVRYDHEETSGPLFDAMALRIDAIASQSGLERIFKLLAADVCEVLAIERIAGQLAQPPPSPPPNPPVDWLASLGGLRTLSVCINRATDLESLYGTVLEIMAGVFGFEHTMLLVPDESGHKLYAVASRGYPSSGAGAEVTVGEGIIGIVARARRMLKLSVDRGLRYAREMARSSGDAAAREVPLPGLPDVDTQIAIPLLVGDKLVGVLAVESATPLEIPEAQEAFLAIVADHIALAIERMMAAGDDEAPLAAAPAPAVAPAAARPRRRFTYYRGDESVFVDDAYLVRNVPGKILWKLLALATRGGRTEFTNRELRLDGALGLPALKDNLESRLILLRRRLEERCPDVRLVPVARGRFALELACDVELSERD